MNVRELLERGAGFYAKREAIADEERRISFEEAWKRGIRFANGMLKMGVKPQERVGVLEDNCLESSDVYIGLAIANMVRVPLYAGSSREIHAHMLGHTNCTALIVGKKRVEEAAKIQNGLSSLKHILIRDKNYEEWLLSQSDKLPEVAINPNDFFIIRHSGGTSGIPKGVGITHRNWIANMRDWFFPLPPIIQGDSFLHVSSMSHASGYMFLPVWVNGGRNILLSECDSSKCVEFLKMEKGNYIFVPPTELNKLVKVALERNELDWPNLKALMIGGASVPARTLQNIRKVFGDVLYQSYGQTETGIIAMGSPFQWYIEGTQKSNPSMACGIPLNFIDIKIIDGNTEQAIGQPGEIVVRTDGMMDHYWGAEKPANTQWICTGDMGKLDSNGFLYILGRKEDVIKINEIEIFPLELENRLCSKLDILEAAVMGVPNEEKSPMIRVICVVRELSCMEKNQVLEVCNELFYIDEISVDVKITTDNLPKNSIGKVNRREIID